MRRNPEIAAAALLAAALLLAPSRAASDPAPEPGALKKAVRVGNPNLERWPASDPLNAIARSVWDLHVYRGRLYVGGGDMYNNKGPVDIWSLGRDGFKREYTAPDEQVVVFREAGGKLVVPAGDPRESWDFGNLYVKDPRHRPNQGWEELRTIPKALHVPDFVCLGKRWFVWFTTDKADSAPVMRSLDEGESWEPFLDNGGSFLPFESFFLIARGAGVLRCDGEKAVPCAVTLFPGSTWTRVVRRVPFGNGVVYSPCMLEWFGAAPVYYLDTAEVKDGGSATVIERFAAERVRDVVARDGVCHVLTAERVRPDAEDFRGVIHSSKDLAEWTVSADFTVPGLPYSLEILDGRFHVGLGMRNAATTVAIEPVGPESGSIWRIE